MVRHLIGAAEAPRYSVDDGGLPVGRVALRDAVAVGLASVGRHTYGEPVLHRWPNTSPSLDIGSFCSLADGVTFLGGGNHRHEWVTTSPLKTVMRHDRQVAQRYLRPASGIVLGNDVWIGANATILDGVTIGDGAVIGFGAVVARDVRPYAVVTGNPAVERRRRFPDDVVDMLLRLQWWRWSDDVILDRHDLLCSSAIERLLDL